MDNRNRDKMSKDSIDSTSAGNVNKDVSRKQSDSSQFGSKIGQSEGLGSSSGRTGGSSEIGSSSSSNRPSDSSSSGWQSSSGRDRKSESSESSDLSGDRGRGSSSGSERH